ncbi:hypothetical protein ACMFMF_005828 [Clarireedia jacksonii]
MPSGSNSSGRVKKEVKEEVKEEPTERSLDSIPEQPPVKREGGTGSNGSSSRRTGSGRGGASNASGSIEYVAPSRQSAAAIRGANTRRKNAAKTFAEEVAEADRLAAEEEQRRKNRERSSRVKKEERRSTSPKREREI